MVRRPLTKSREKEERAAAQDTCSKLIQQVESAHLGRVSCDGPFFMEFMATADELRQSLEVLGIPVPYDLQRFDEQATHPRVLTVFGLPVYEEDFVLIALVSDLIPMWLQYMREFHQELTELKLTRRKTKPRSGRPKEESTERLYADIEKFLRKQREHLEKNGASAEVIRDKQKQLTWKGIIQGINEDCGKEKYKLDEATRKKVQGSPAWKRLRSADFPSPIAEEMTEDSPIFHPDRIAFDHSRALEESLRPSKREHRRTKFPAR